MAPLEVRLHVVQVDQVRMFQIEALGNAAQFINVTGRFNANKFSVTRQAAKSKPVDLQLDYKVAVNLADKTALISTFNLTGTQDQSPLIRGALTRPSLKADQWRSCNSTCIRQKRPRGGRLLQEPSCAVRIVMRSARRS